MSKLFFVSGDALRLVGIMGVGLAIVWALQSLGFGGAWVVGVAAIAGAGTGLLGASQAEATAQAAVDEPGRRRG